MDSEKNKLVEFFASESRKFLRYVLGKFNTLSEMDAEDIIGDVMLKLFTRTDKSGPLDNPAAYIYRMLQNKAIDYLRRESRMVSLESFLDEDGELRLMGLIADGSPSVADASEKREFVHRLGEAISTLEPKQRAVFIATEMDGISFKELSERWHEPIGTLLSRKSRAVKSLRELLNDQKYKGEKL